ncbi:TetR/AcrR family transcriptional regulator [Amycolatopsis rubida]|uniref:TetR/AcrR family transcriptional regulator n=2 Tax=Pseudonocardiaceae TaxID=2070 RepID=A0ABX0C546_9PSEU|nr:TetR family transcriptional regulator [Amycolatopsis rubida]NEC61754.1 TetR/AcrR family transcriptional regulator [Amycolatopsis rubida]OAP25759.1 putative HTH-type transcriptional regulator YxaF [Amycolatopsis sp. M39]
MTERPARERMVFSAAQLLRTQGLSGTGMREVVAHAEAPRGSLQHYFPGGKEQLFGEAIDWAGRYAARRVTRAMDSLTDPTPSALFAGVVEYWRAEFLEIGYDYGCPLVATVADTAASSEPLRERANDAFAQWRKPIVSALQQMGVPAARAASLAVLMISALEGALVLARVEHAVTALDSVVEELGPVLDAAVDKRRRR